MDHVLQDGEVFMKTTNNTRNPEAGHQGALNSMQFQVSTK